MAQANVAQVAKRICICAGANGQFFCLECEQYFCQSCRISHMKAKVSKNHQLVESLGTGSSNCEICLKYAGQYHCLDCSQYFCGSCKTSHLRANVSKNHVFRDSSYIETIKAFKSGTHFVKITNMETKVKETQEDLKNEDSDSKEITGATLPGSNETEIQRLISDFKSSMVIDLVSIPYRSVQDSSPKQYLLKLQTEHPDVTFYSKEGKCAESSFDMYVVSMNRNALAIAKKRIQTECIKSSKRSGRFSESYMVHSNTKLTSSVQNKLPVLKTYKTAEGLAIHVYMGSIIRLDVDCIVNAANSHLMHGGGLAAVIADAAGTAFNRECYDYVKSHGDIKTGSCCVTRAGNLRYRCVIHAVGPHWSKGKANECCDLLQKTIEQCIQTANDHQMTSVAVPSISAGLYGMPADLCAKSYAVGVMTVSANRTSRWSLKEVHFVDDKPEMVIKVQRAFSDIFCNY